MANTINTRMIMDRLNDNPNMKSLKQSSVAAYIKDLASINNIAPLLGILYVYRKVEDYKAELPQNCLKVNKVYVCETLNPALFENNSLNAATDDYDAKIAQNELGVYKEEGGILFVDIAETVVYIEYTGIILDDYGFPSFPYDGSLMQAIEWYVKWRYYTILWEIKMVERTHVQESARQYAWYIGQYVSRQDMLDYDEAVSVANSWQRLLDTRNRNTGGKQFSEFVNI